MLFTNKREVYCEKNPLNPNVDFLLFLIKIIVFCKHGQSSASSQKIKYQEQGIGLEQSVFYRLGFHLSYPVSIKIMGSTY